MSSPAAWTMRWKTLSDAAGARWSGFAPRERALMLVFAGVATLGALYYLAVVPLLSVRAAARADIAGYSELAARLSALDPADVDAVPAEQREGTPSEIIAATVEEFGIPVTSSVATDGGVRIQLGNVAYARLLEWLVSVERTSPLRVTRLRIARAPVAGQVRADLVLAR